MREIDRRTVLQKQRKREEKLVSIKPEGEDPDYGISDDDDFSRGGLEEEVLMIADIEIVKFYL